ncbi:MAG: hypothetical protein KatS3mg068_2114 [Candidatus Sericytochromatia bacterium]|nr:MAG: hypothetical protein KatS3mg068_2114 [Candidatus Sericytochromatia bacterium]
MRYKFYFIIFILLFIFSCSAIISKKENDIYTVKIINSSNDKVLVRFEDENNYRIRVVDENSSIKFQMNGELVIQYVILNYEDFKILSIKQHTFIHVLKNNIIIDELPKEDIIK